jgi:Ca2+-transporting ATPase
VTGSELELMDDQALAEAVAAVRIFSRLLPHHKLRIVEALQARGEVVAMTGDGLNDAPALKKADIGVAMGKRGSEVAREVSDIVLLDDQFSTIVHAIEEGRIIYRNIMNFIRFTSSSNVALMVLVLGGAFGSMFLGLEDARGEVLLPLTALQILWINFMGDGPPALALAIDRGSDVLREPPHPRAASLLDGRTVRFILADGGFKGAVGLGLLVFLPMLGTSLPATAASVFVYESLGKLASVYPARRIGAGTSKNAWLHVSVASGVVLALLCVLLEPLRLTMGLAPLESSAFGALTAAIALTLVSGELLARTFRAHA